MLFVRSRYRHDSEVKILFLGETGAGKTSLIRSYVDDVFVEKISPCKFEVVSRVTVVNDKRVNVELWDTPGFTSSNNIPEIHFSSVDAVVMVFDSTIVRAFLAMIVWYSYVKLRLPPDTPIFFVGTKFESENEITFKDVKELSRMLGVPAFMTSARTGFGVKEAFNGILIEMCPTLQLSTDAGEYSTRSRQRWFPNLWALINLNWLGLGLWGCCFPWRSSRSSNNEETKRYTLAADCQTLDTNEARSSSPPSPLSPRENTTSLSPDRDIEIKLRTDDIGISSSSLS